MAGSCDWIFCNCKEKQIVSIHKNKYQQNFGKTFSEMFCLLYKLFPVTAAPYRWPYGTSSVAALKWRWSYTVQNMPEYGYSLTVIFSYNYKIINSVLIGQYMGQQKPLFLNILCSVVSKLHDNTKINLFLYDLCHPEINMTCSENFILLWI